MLDRLYSTAETAEALGISERALERLRSVGGGPRFCRIGPRQVRYRESDLNSWVASRTFAHHSAEQAAERAA